MTYVLLHHVCFWQFAYLVTINFQEFSIIYFIMKVVHNHLFANSLKLLFCVVLTGVFIILLYNVAFDGVLGGVMGTVCCIVFGILSSFLDFIWDGILGMTTCGSNSYFDFQGSNALLKLHLVCNQSTFFLELVHFEALWYVDASSSCLLFQFQDLWDSLQLFCIYENLWELQVS